MIQPGGRVEFIVGIFESKLTEFIFYLFPGKRSPAIKKFGDLKITPDTIGEIKIIHRPGAKTQAFGFYTVCQNNVPIVKEGVSMFFQMDISIQARGTITNPGGRSTSEADSL